MMFRDKRLDIGIGISIILHILLFILFSGSGKLTTFDYEDIKEITFIDQSYRPEVARVISKGSIWSDIKDSYSDAEPSAYGGEIVTPAIDLDAKLDRSQATIDLDRYMVSEDIGDVVRIGNGKAGTMKSTDEILAEKPISLARNLPKGAGGEGGVGIGGAGSIGRKAQAPTIKIDKKPPAPKTSAIGKKVEATVEQQLKVEKGKTQISLAGPIAGRQILSKILPKYPVWCLRQGISGVVKIRIWVESSGDVREGSLIEISSGYPDLDQVVINAIKKWRFAPLPSNVVQETQWGVVTFRFVCG